MSTAYERAVESLRLVSREMELADIPATDLVMATAAVNAMRDEITRLWQIEHDISLNLGSYESIVEGLRASRDPGVQRDREGAIAFLGETLAVKVRATLEGGSE